MKQPRSFMFLGREGRRYRVFFHKFTGYWFAAYHDGQQRRRETLTVRTRAEAEQKVQQLDAAPIRQEPCGKPLEDRLAWPEFQRRYLEYKAQQGKAPRSVARFKAALDACGRYLETKGIRYIQEVTLTLLEGYPEFRTQTEGCQVKTAYTDILALKNALKWGSKPARGLLKANPALEWETQKPVTPKRRTYSAAEVTAMEAGVRDWLKPIVTTLALSGLRVGELVTLRWQDVDLAGRVLRVCVQEDWKPKGRRDRLVPMHPKVEAAVRRQALGKYVFRGPKGGRIKETYALQCLKADQRRLCLSEGDLHGFRRYFATSMMKAGVPVETVRQWGGWQSLETMLRYLADVDVKESVQAMEQAVKRLATA